jgi:hypothetical protein
MAGKLPVYRGASHERRFEFLSVELAGTKTKKIVSGNKVVKFVK